jgi:urocanate hydratase
MRSPTQSRKYCWLHYGLCWGQCKDYNIRHSQGWINEVIDIDELVKSSIRLKPTKKLYRSPTLGMWLTFGRNLTKRYSYRFGKRPDLHNPYAGGYYPTDISLRMRMRWWQKTLYYSKKRYRKHYATAINKHSKRNLFLWLWKCVPIRSFSRRSGYNGRQSYWFQILSYVQDIMGPMCFDYGLVLSVGFVLQENRRIYKNRYHRLPC